MPAAGIVLSLLPLSLSAAVDPLSPATSWARFASDIRERPSPPAEDLVDLVAGRCRSSS
jgi:hypothetical protein